tara:strand:- start:492 stop:1115 length:624 start_codon:yes stop_codon:yes gene_type:complete
MKIKFSKKEILDSDKEYRINLINSITGIKPANLISTISKSGIPNVAIFSSVIHLGSNPPLIGFILRPETKKLSDTMENIREMQYYTINHINPFQIRKAHQTSKKLDKNISEFDLFKIDKEYIEDIDVPFVKDSLIRIGLKYKSKIDIELNNTALIIGEVVYIDIEKNIINTYGQLNLEKSNAIGVGGLDTYYYLNKLVEINKKYNEI